MHLKLSNTGPFVNFFQETGPKRIRYLECGPDHGMGDLI
jgi:hypothetical protein